MNKIRINLSVFFGVSSFSIRSEALQINYDNIEIINNIINNIIIMQVMESDR